MASIELSKRHFAKAMSYVALSRVKTIDGLRILGLKEKNVLTLEPGKAPCSDDAVRELYRLRLMKIGIADYDEVSPLLDWILDYPTCINCRKWICLCTCQL